MENTCGGRYVIKDMNCWQIEKRTVRSRGRHLFENGLWYDCKFIVGESPNQEILGAHKTFLAMTSPVFEAMLFGSMSEKTDPIPIPDVQPEAFKALLKYIYSDELKLNCFQVAGDLYYCAKKYIMPDLAAKCSNYLKSILSPDKLWRVYYLAELFEEPELIEQCLKFMRTETKKILTDASWKNVAKASILVLFQQNILAIDSEINLYDALLVWSEAECQRKSLPSDQKSLRSISGDLLAEIRFLTLTPEQFANGPGKAEILDKDEILALIMNISSAKSSIPMPQGFSLEKNHRVKPDDDEETGFASLRDDVWAPLFNRHGFRQKIQKYCCLRSFASLRDFINDGHHECSLAFRVDTSIKICGVAVSAQVPTFNGLLTFYAETLNAYLHDSDGRRLTDGRFTGQVRRDSIVKIYFHNHVDIESNKEYRIGVVLNHPGTYPDAEDCAETANCAEVNFSFAPFDHITGYPNIDGVIRGIVFTK